MRVSRNLEGREEPLVETETAVGRATKPLRLNGALIGAALDSLAEARWEAMRAKPGGGRPGWEAMAVSPDPGDLLEGRDTTEAAEERRKAAEEQYRATRDAFEAIHGRIDY